MQALSRLADVAGDLRRQMRQSSRQAGLTKADPSDQDLALKAAIMSVPSDCPQTRSLLRHAAGDVVLGTLNGPNSEEQLRRNLSDQKFGAQGDTYDADKVDAVVAIVMQLQRDLPKPEAAPV